MRQSSREGDDRDARQGIWCTAGINPRIVAVLFVALFVLPAALIVAAPPAGAIEGAWTSYLNVNDLRGLVATEEGIWCATGGGALFYDPASGEMEAHHRSADGLSSDSLVTVSVDEAGLLAFGTAAAGVSFYDPLYETWYAETSLTWPLGSDRVRFIRQEPQWQIVGSEGGFVARRDGEVKRICQEGLDICGLPSWDVRAGLYHDGYLWFGTSPGTETIGGVCRLNYDNEENPLGVWDTLNTGLSDPAVTDLELYGGELFCATESGIDVWNGTQWESRREGISSGATVSDLYVGASGLYAAVAASDFKGGVFVYDSDELTWTRVGAAGNEQAREFFFAECLLEAHGTLWVGTSATHGIRAYLTEEEEGLWELVGDTWVQHRHDGPHYSAWYWDVVADDDGRVYASVAGSGPWRIARYDPSLETTWKVFSSYNTEMSNAWPLELRLGDDQIWIGRCCCSADANCKLDLWDLTTDEIETYPELYNIWDSAEDAWGNFWFGSFYEAPEEHPDRVHGVFHWRRDVDPPVITQYTVESTDAELRSDGISALEAEGNSLWIGYPGHGLSRLRLADDGSGPWPFGDPWTHYKADDSDLVGDRIRALASPGDGVIWIGTDSGISIRSAGQWRTLGIAAGLPGSQILDIAFTSDGAAWVAIEGQGVTRITQKPNGAFEFETFSEPEITSRFATALTPGPQGTDVWVATRWGLSHFVPSSSIEVRHLDGLPIYPNPYNPHCGQAAAFVELPGRIHHGVIVDTSGRVVATLGDIGVTEPYEFWDGRDLDGEFVAPGLYLVRVATPQGYLTGQVAVLDLPCDAGY